MEVIPLKVFLAPSPGVLSALDGGLSFFIGTGVVLLGLIVAEKLGLPINETAVRWLVRGGVLGFIVWWVLTSPLMRHLFIGF